MSALVQRGKKGIWCYVNKGKWRSTKTPNRPLAEKQQRLWDEEEYKEVHLGIKPPMSWEEFWPKYKATYARNHPDFDSQVKLDIAGRYFVQFVKPVFLRDITRENYDDLVNGMLATMQPQSCNAYLTLLVPIIEAAHAYGHIDKNPWFEVKPVPVVKEEAAWLESEDLEKVREDLSRNINAPHPVSDEEDAAEEIWLSFLLLRQTGMRINEMAHQRLEDVNFEEGFLKVAFHSDGAKTPHCECYCCLKEHRRLLKKGKDVWGWRPKTKRERFIPLGPELLRAIMEIRKERKTGCIIERHHSTLYHGIKRAYKRLDLKGKLGCHTIRHSFATEMEACGMSAKAIKGILGHSQGREGSAMTGSTAHYIHTKTAELKLEFQKLLAYWDTIKERAKKEKFNII